MAKQQTSGGLNRFYWIIGSIAVLGLIIVGYQVGVRGQAAAAPVVVEGLDDPEVLLQMAQGKVQGDPNAPVTIYEFGDYQCPACGMFALQVKPLVDQAYIAEGKAKFVYYDFPLIQIHPNAFLAARAGRCAGDQDAFWQYHDALFRNQSAWASDPSPIGRFVDYAESAELDGGAFESCLRSDRYADVVTANLRLGEELGVGGTPTVMVQGNGQLRVVQNNSFQGIEAAIAAIEGASRN